MTAASRLARSVSTALLPRQERERLAHLRFHDAGHGYDLLGLELDALIAAVAASSFLYERYFRVSSHGAEHIPAEGAAVLACNHSGLLALDGVVVVMDVLRHTNPPRLPRAVGDLFLQLLPWVGAMFARVGVVSGTRGNFRHLLESGELALVFPEGTPGIGKGYKKRYQLQEWRVGHVELALRQRAPVVPVAVIGAEESWPQIARIDGVRAFGAPYLPIPATPFPLPTHHHVYYGQPLYLHERYPPDGADDPEVTDAAAAEVKAAVAALIERGLAERPGVFR